MQYSVPAVFNVQLVSWGSWIDIWPDRQLLIQKMESSLNSEFSQCRRPFLEHTSDSRFLPCLVILSLLRSEHWHGFRERSNVITITYDKGQGRRHHLALVLQDYLEYKRHE
jgi:hypothetical protein